MHTTTYIDGFNGPISARFDPKARALFIHERKGGVISISAYGDGLPERLRLAAAAINGDLRDLLDDLYEFVDDLGDGAPDSPPHAHRALNLAARLDELLGRPPAAPRKTPQPCSIDAYEQGCLCHVPAPGPTDIDPPEPKRHPECPLHGHRDPDAELDAKRDEEMMERIGTEGPL